MVVTQIEVLDDVNKYTESLQGDQTPCASEQTKGKWKHNILSDIEEPDLTGMENKMQVDLEPEPVDL